MWRTFETRPEQIKAIRYLNHDEFYPREVVTSVVPVGPNMLEEVRGVYIDNQFVKLVHGDYIVKDGDSLTVMSADDFLLTYREVKGGKQ